MPVNRNRIGLVFAALFAGWHLVWAILVLAGWAQAILNFFFWAHMIQPIYIVKPFDWVAAVTLIISTAVVGFIFGYIGATIWNRLRQS